MNDKLKEIVFIIDKLRQLQAGKIPGRISKSAHRIRKTFSA